MVRFTGVLLLSVGKPLLRRTFLMPHCPGLGDRGREIKCPLYFSVSPILGFELYGVFDACSFKSRATCDIFSSYFHLLFIVFAVFAGEMSIGTSTPPSCWCNLLLDIFLLLLPMWLIIVKIINSFPLSKYLFSLSIQYPNLWVLARGNRFQPPSQ